MSRLNVDAIHSEDGADACIELADNKNVTFKGNIAVDGTIPADKLTGTLPAISGANLTGVSSPGSFRNLIINGAMQVNQRGTIANAGNQYGGPDRWYFFKNDGGMTVSQDTDVPTGQGFGNSYKIDVTSTAGASGAYYVGIQQKIEGQDLQRVKKGSSNAQSLTLSFWIKSTKTGTYIAELDDWDNTRSCSKTYTVNTTNTWEKKTVTFPADTTGAFGNDTGASLVVSLWCFAGSSFQGGTLATTWESKTNANRAEGQVNACDNTSNNIYFTGIQLEIGTTATDFEYRSFGDELWACRRYFQASKADDNDFLFGPGYEGGAGSFYMPVMLNPPMRGSPSMQVVSGNWKQVGDGGQSSEYTGAMTAYDQQPGPIHTSLLFWKDTDYPSSCEGRTQWMRAGENSTIVALNAEI